MLKDVAKIGAAILGTGVLLNVAGSGMLGTSVQKMAQFITKGYGV